MNEESVVFSGENFTVWGFVLSHICALFLYNYEHNYMLRFSSVGYWECNSYLNGKISIRKGDKMDIQLLVDRGINIDINHLLVLRNRGHDYVIECTELRFVTLDSKRPSRSDEFVFGNEGWERLWLDGNIVKAIAP